MAVRWKKPKKPVFGQIPQATIFNAAEKQKNDGIEAAYRGADNEWKRAAIECLQKMIRTRELVTSEDVVLELNKRGIMTSENRAMGAIMQSFSRAGLIESTGRFTTSRRPECHKSPVRVWRSKKFEGLL
jgi:hypothetical protein